MTRAALGMLDGRAGPGGETLHVGLLRLPAMHPDRLWWRAYTEQEQYKGGGDGDKWEGSG
jgi:hypothetical protein